MFLLFELQAKLPYCRFKGCGTTHDRQHFLLGVLNFLSESCFFWKKNDFFADWDSFVLRKFLVWGASFGKKKWREKSHWSEQIFKEKRYTRQTTPWGTVWSNRLQSDIEAEVEKCRNLSRNLSWKFGQDSSKWSLWRRFHVEIEDCPYIDLNKLTRPEDYAMGFHKSPAPTGNVALGQLRGA